MKPTPSQNSATLDSREKNSGSWIWLLLISGFFWGGSFVAIKAILDAGTPPWSSAALRLLIASLFLGTYVKFRKMPLFPHRRWWLKIWMGGLIAVGIPFAFLFWGEQNVSASVAGLLNATSPLWTIFILFSLALIRKQARPSPIIMTALLLGFAGILWIFLPHLLRENARSETLGILALSMMALCYGISAIYNKNLVKAAQQAGVSFETLVFQQHLSSCLFLCLFAFSFENLQQAWRSFALLSVQLGLLYLGVISSGIAFLIYFYLLRTVGSVKTSFVAYMIPPSAFLLDFVFFGHRPGWSLLGGAVLIFSSLILLRFSKQTT